LGSCGPIYALLEREACQTAQSRSSFRGETPFAFLIFNRRLQAGVLLGRRENYGVVFPEFPRHSKWIEDGKDLMFMLPRVLGKARVADEEFTVCGMALVHAYEEFEI
jgi:hypothetical protein